MFIDSHVHLDGFPDQEVSEILGRARAAGVGAVICAGTTLESSRRSIALSRSFPGFFSGVGIHPMDIEKPFDETTYQSLREMALSSEKVVVMSETGLDFMEGTPDRAIQYHAFREQIHLARELRLPIVFHSRDSHDEVFRVLREERAYEVVVVMHYFQGSYEDAQRCIDLGFYVSLARPLLRLPHLQDAASRLSLDNIVLETDAAPQPFKAKRESWTEPRHVREVAEKLAQLQNRPLAEIEQTTTRNIQKLLGDRWAVIEKHVAATE